MWWDRESGVDRDVRERESSGLGRQVGEGRQGTEHWEMVQVSGLVQVSRLPLV